MSYVNPALRSKFESLSIDLKNEILSRNVTINNLQDLIDVLQQIIDEAEDLNEHSRDTACMGNLQVEKKPGKNTAISGKFPKSDLTEQGVSFIL